MKFLHKLQRSPDFWFILASSFVFFLLRLPSFFEPYWYGDEGVYEILGFGIRHGRLLYQGIWDNKPPLLYLIYALFDGNQSFVRFFSFLVGLTAIWIFFSLTKRLFGKKISIFTTTGIFTLLLGLPLLEGNIANAENFMVLPVVAAVFLVVKTIQDNKRQIPNLFFAGLLLGIAFLIKVVSVFDYATLLTLLSFVALDEKRFHFRQLFNKVFFLTLGFMLPLLATVGFFTAKGILTIFIQSAFLSNIGYVNYGNQFIIPQGFLIFKLILLAAFILILFFKRRSLPMFYILIYLWVAFSLFDAFFSQRPYTHYTLVLLGSMSLLTGLLFEKKKLFISALILIISVILIGRNFSLYNKTFGYYENFIQELTGQKTVTAYQSFFDKGVPGDYAIVALLKSNLGKNQTAFLWTNSAQMYYLLQELPPGRYTVAYHITASQKTLLETSQALQRTYPKFVVIMPNAPTFPFSMRDYVLRLQIDNGLIYERTF